MVLLNSIKDQANLLAFPLETGLAEPDANSRFVRFFVTAGGQGEASQ